eukprot:11422743-Ditylum_brightwellii.AAC.1
MQRKRTSIPECKGAHITNMTIHEHEQNINVKMVKWCYDCLLIGSDGASQVSKSALDQDAHKTCSYAAANKCS